MNAVNLCIWLDTCQLIKGNLIGEKVHSFIMPSTWHPKVDFRTVLEKPCLSSSGLVLFSVRLHTFGNAPEQQIASNSPWARVQSVVMFEQDTKGSVSSWAILRFNIRSIVAMTLNVIPCTIVSIILSCFACYDSTPLPMLTSLRRLSLWWKNL